MAVSITSVQLAAALRVGDGLSLPPEPVGGVVTRLLSAATELVQDYAPDAPEGVQNEAVVRVCGWLFDAVPGRTFANAMDLSGAKALIAPYRARRARVLA